MIGNPTLWSAHGECKSPCAFEKAREVRVQSVFEVVNTVDDNARRIADRPPNRAGRGRDLDRLRCSEYEQSRQTEDAEALLNRMEHVLLSLQLCYQGGKEP